MTTYVYKAKKTSAETVMGEINADSQDEAIDLINQLGLLPVTIEAQSHEIGDIDLGKVKKVASKDLYIFSRQLANLLKSGVSILRALMIIQDQTQNPYFKKIIDYVGREIKNGRSFADSLADFPQIFSTLYITMVNAGEESGRLQQMLMNISDYQRRQEEIRSKVRTALAYPLLMALVGLATVYFMLTFALPKMAGLFSNLGDSLPLPTTILLMVSRVLNKGWFFILGGLVGGIFFFRRWSQSEKGRGVLSRFILNLPFFGQVILKVELARFCGTLVLLLKSGIPVVRALNISIPMLSNELIKTQLNVCSEELTAGGSFGETLKKSTAIPPMIGHLVAIGEESGSLNDVLADIAETYEMETSEQIKILTTLLEPLMILGIGIVVGFIVIAMLLPIFEIHVLAQ